MQHLKFDCDDFQRKPYRHMFKLDPNKSITDEQLERLAHSGTDGFIVGGTDGITKENVSSLYQRLKRYALPICYEMSTEDTFVFGFDLYFIPIVLNTSEIEWISGKHLKALKEYGEWLSLIPHETLGYIVLHEHCKVAKLTKAITTLNHEEIFSCIQLATEIFHLSLIYIEYSGKYGDVEVMKRIAKKNVRAHIFYGGGIRTKEEAIEMANYADTVVVGNIIYEDFEQALKTVFS